MNLLVLGMIAALNAQLAQAEFKSLDTVWGSLRADVEMDSTFRGERGHKGIVAADDRIAAEWGVEILKKGGNAVDAAVATAWMMAVTRPHYASIGGGGFLVFCTNQGDASQVCKTIDYREMASQSAHRDLYVKDQKLLSNKSRDGALASGVPGVVAGLILAQKKYGKLKLRDVLSRPIEVAKKGFRFTGRMESLAVYRNGIFNAPAKKLFMLKAGDLLVQSDLARVLEEIAKNGEQGFYQGWVAQKISSEILKAGGILTLQDFKSYKAVERKPIIETVGPVQLVSMGPPSSGGAILAMALKYAQIADKSGEFEQGPHSAKTLHAIAHSLALAFSERPTHFGDPDFVKVPIAKLLDTKYLEARWQQTFKPDQANIPKSSGLLPESMETTHLSVMDREGNAVSLTTTVNDHFGSGFVPLGTGIVMNNQMDDFSIQAGTPNLFGLVGAEANAIKAGKRPLSSMTPTVVRDLEGNNRIAIGAEGGPRIISSTFNALLNRLRFGMSLPDSVMAARVHHQFVPEDLFVELNGFSFETRQNLLAKGWKLKDTADNAYMHAVERFPRSERVWGIADPRTEGAVIVE